MKELKHKLYDGSTRKPEQVTGIQIMDMKSKKDTWECFARIRSILHEYEVECNIDYSCIPVWGGPTPMEKSYIEYDSECKPIKRKYE